MPVKAQAGSLRPSQEHILVSPHGAGPLPAYQETTVYSCPAQTLGVSSRSGLLYRFSSLGSLSSLPTLENLADWTGTEEGEKGQDRSGGPPRPQEMTARLGGAPGLRRWTVAPTLPILTCICFPPPSLRCLPPALN